MVFAEAIACVRLMSAAYAAANYASSRGAPGMEFNSFGRKMGWRLLFAGERMGVGYILTPVSIVRHFEFPFVLENLPTTMRRCLDVGSPRLFSLYIGLKLPKVTITMINPDVRDITGTQSAISKLRLRNIKCRCITVEEFLEQEKEVFDCVWSISVVEHIGGDEGDVRAVRFMYEALEDGGRLILTVPVDRIYREEYRDHDLYGIQPKGKNGRYFFSRVYDRNTLWDRLVAAVGQEPAVVRWFGEKTPGRYLAYEEKWMREGRNCTVHDPREIADHYCEFSSWEEMPGAGVCGLVFEK